MQEVQGIDAGPVTAWFDAHVPGVAPPLTFDLIAGGHSNLTFAVTDSAGARWVLRRPPLGQVLATAHDMGREHTIISALGPTDVPVAPAIGLCTDESVNGAPFYVMGYVDGTVVRDAGVSGAMSPEARHAASDSVVDVLASIHSVDVDAVGLGDLGRREGYIERQLKRWYGQWEKSKTRELAAVDDVYRALAARVPDQGPAAIVHGDYRLDNCMLGDDGRIVAVLDWELCTLGDPLADVGLLMVYWADPGEEGAIGAAPTAVDGFATRKELLERYADASGRDLAHVDFYVAFGYWKLACIVEGVYARYVGGAMGTRDPSAFSAFAQQVERCAANAAEAVARLG
jgi:aminoglycoside phosphotransferase (APT) family kinase protein